jgi:positive phototaxis protein PixI
MTSDLFSQPRNPPSDNNFDNNFIISKEVGQFLRFYLIPNTTGLLPITQLVEVLTIPNNQIVPIPQMPNWVMGVYNWRGTILWMVDLGNLVGLTPWYEQRTNTSNYVAIVLQDRVNQVEPKLLGLMVNRVEEIEWCNLDSIQSPPPGAVSPELLPYLQGYWLKSNGEMLAVLEGAAIMAAMPNSVISDQ